tara:strand:+ start:6147 stop:7892 length:1746 start_codon:yes stop_codon:yes gene_type:complete
VVLTDSRFPIKRTKSGKTVIKIGTKEINLFLGRDLSELLSSYSGINIIGSNSYSGQNLTYSIRGGRSKQVLILVDGIRVSDPSRIDDDFNLNFLNLANIESIEIIKGATSTLYGSSAAAGVINIITKKNYKNLTLNFNSSLGTENSVNLKPKKLTYFKNSLSIGSKLKGLNFNFNLSKKNTEGMSAVIGGTEIDPFSSTNYSFNIQNAIEKKFNWKLITSIDKIQADYDNSFPVEDANFKLKTNQKRISLLNSYSFEKGSINLNIGFQEIFRDFQSSFPFKTLSSNLYSDFFIKYLFSQKLYSIIGFNKKISKANYENSELVKHDDYYINFVYLSSKNLNLNVGGRLNNNEKYGTQLTYNINPSIGFSLNDYFIKLFASNSTSFISPSLYQIYDVYSGNLNLEPEQSTTTEYGLELFLSSGGRTSIQLFNRKQNPSIIYDFETFKYGNSPDNIQFSGIEIEYENKVFKNFNIMSSFSHIYSNNGDLRYIPKNSFKMTTNITINTKSNVFVGMKNNSSSLSLDQNSYNSGYFVLDLKYNYLFDTKNVSLFFWITNLFDKKYVEIENYNTRGRNFKIGININI